MGALASYNPSQIGVIRRTVASDTNNDEFDLFMEACKSYQLDPFRKQINAVVYNKTKPDKRKMSIIVARDGLRVIAQRCGDYRPASERPQVEYDDGLASPTNPKGIVSVSVKLWKRDGSGDWYPVFGEAYWDEFAPIEAEWAWDAAAGKRQPTGQKSVSGNWAKMPIVMITKCAESQALRAGWPDQFSGLYVEEEMDRVTAEHTASEIAERHAEEQRMARIGGTDTITMMFDGTQLENVPVGQLYDRAVEFVQSSEPETVYRWRVQNEDPLREFWAKQPDAAHDLKQKIEAKAAEFESAAA